MNHSDFPYRNLLVDLTAKVAERGYDPFEAYALFVERQNADGLLAETYCSTSITSGGHARDSSLAMQDIIASNTRLASDLAEQLAQDRQITAASTIEPVFVGKTGWDQAEYMRFWMAVIGGFEIPKGFSASNIDNLRAACLAAESEHEVDIANMISANSAEDRAIEYFKQAQAYSGLVHVLGASPVRQLVRMIDTEQSLGAQAESVFARLIGTSVKRISLVRPADLEDLRTRNCQLTDDLQRVISFGAAVFDSANNQVRLQLVDDYAA